MQEHVTAVSASPEVEYVRGSDYGGGIGGLLYSVRGTGPSFNHYNSRGDVIAKTDGLGALTYEGQYEAFGKRTEEIGINIDRQTANTKDEDPHGLLNEGMRYRDLETGSFITRDPAGFVDGPNVYTYVRQNPWTKFDPFGLWETGSYWGDVGQVFKGYGRAAVNTAKGVGTMIAHPVQTAKGVAAAVSSPIETGKAIIADVQTKLQTNAGAGEIVGDILIGVATGGTAKAVSQTAAVAKLVDKVGDLADVAKLTNKVDDLADAAKTTNQRLQNVGCFIVGTTVLAGAEYQAIETVTVGQRVNTPQGNAVQDSLPADDYRLVTLQKRDPASGEVVFEVRTLQTLDHLEGSGLAVGGTVWHEVEEIGFADHMKIVAITAAPQFAKTEGRLVTTTYAGYSQDVWLLWAGDATEAIGVTGGHPIYSETRGDYVPAASLSVGEVLRTATGTVQVDRLEPLPGRHRVYNFTVDVEHCYYVGDDSILAHNAGNPCAAGADSAKAAPRSTVTQNKAAGDAWEADIINNQLPATQTGIQPQITIQSSGPSGMRVRLDAVGTDGSGAIRLTDGKASPTAPHTPNQTVVYPELEVHGGTVVGKGKGAYPGGTVIPPTKVDIIRKP